MPMVVCISSESSGTRHKTIGPFLEFRHYFDNKTREKGFIIEILPSMSRYNSICENGYGGYRYIFQGGVLLSHLSGCREMVKIAK